MLFRSVPFELDYAIMDKKFGINVIGGISSLFLVDNSIQLESPSQNLLTEMGEANKIGRASCRERV